LLTVAKQSFCAAYPVVLIFVAMRGLTLQQNQLFHWPLQIWSFQHVNFYHACLISVSTNGKRYGTAVKVINGNKLHSIYPTVGILKHSKNMSRYDSVLLNRLRIGHSRLTHSCLLSGDAPPTCQSCGIPVTVKHLLVECSNLRDIREKYFTVSSVTDLFKSIGNHTIINFVKETDFYHQL